MRFSQNGKNPSYMFMSEHIRSIEALKPEHLLAYNILICFTRHPLYFYTTKKVSLKDLGTTT